MERKNEKNIEKLIPSIEAIVFMHGVPVKETRLAEILDETLENIQKAIGDLKTEYKNRNSGLSILHTDKEVQIVTNKEQSEIIQKFTKKELEGDLSKAALEVLAIIAYRGPITKSDIETIRGVNCSFSLRNLLLRGLISKKPHPTDFRTQIYAITPDFYRFLGISDKEELPDYKKLVGDYRIDVILRGEQEDKKMSNSKSII